MTPRITTGEESNFLNAERWVPRSLKALELAEIINSKFGNVCSTSIDTDPELKEQEG